MPSHQRQHPAVRPGHFSNPFRDVHIIRGRVGRAVKRLANEADAIESQTIRERKREKRKGAEYQKKSLWACNI
jgi:hypothetical protein